MTCLSNLANFITELSIYYNLLIYTKILCAKEKVIKKIGCWSAILFKYFCGFCELLNRVYLSCWNLEYRQKVYYLRLIYSSTIRFNGNNKFLIRSYMFEMRKEYYIFLSCFSFLFLMLHSILIINFYSLRIVYSSGDVSYHAYCE